jgi:hypothetical protein
MRTPRALRDRAHASFMLRELRKSAKMVRISSVTT